MGIYCQVLWAGGLEGWMSSTGRGAVGKRALKMSALRVRLLTRVLSAALRGRKVWTCCPLWVLARLQMSQSSMVWWSCLWAHVRFAWWRALWRLWLALHWPSWVVAKRAAVGVRLHSLFHD